MWPRPLRFRGEIFTHVVGLAVVDPLAKKKYLRGFKI